MSIKIFINLQDGFKTLTQFFGSSAGFAIQGTTGIKIFYLIFYEILVDLRKIRSDGKAYHPGRRIDAGNLAIW